MITARWQLAYDPWCTVVCVSTWRNVPRNIRDGPIVPRRNVFSGCGCKQPAVRARHDLSRAWRISTCRPNIVLYRIETRRVSQMEVCCSTGVSWFGMLLLATREEIHLREGDISHWPTLPFHYPLFTRSFTSCPSRARTAGLQAGRGPLELDDVARLCACYSSSCKLFPWAKQFVNQLKNQQLRSGVYTESGIYSFRWGIYFLYISSSMTLDNCDYRCCSCFHWIKRNELNYGRLI